MRSGRAAVEYGDDIRMAEAGEHTGLALKPLGEGRIRPQEQVTKLLTFGRKKFPNSRAIGADGRERWPSLHLLLRLSRLAFSCEPNGGASLHTVSVGIPRMAMPPVGSQLAWNQDSGLSRTANTSSAATSASTPAPDTGINRSASSAVGTSKAAFSFR